MWFLVLFLICGAAYLAGRSRFWHVVCARFLLVTCVLWFVFVFVATISKGEEWLFTMMFLPIIMVWCGATILRWVFSPPIPQVPIVSTALCRIAAYAIWRHVDRHLHHFAGREIW